jgi:hypothetical protein
MCMSADVWESDDEAAAVMERLMGAEEDDFEAGRGHGQQWAKRSASIRDLRELAEVDFDDFDGLALRSDSSLHAALMEDGLLRGREDVDAFMRGVLQGAREVFLAVRQAEPTRGREDRS